MKTAKLFRNGQSQAARLPREFRFEGDEVFIKKSGSRRVQAGSLPGLDRPITLPTL